MPKIEQILPVSGPMDDSLDTEYLQSGKGQLRKRNNMRPNNIGGMFVNTPILGTLLYDMVDPEFGDNTTIGWCNDNENEAIIWFVYNSNLDHCIYRLFTLTGTVQRIFFEERTLGFTSGTLVNAEVIDGRLYWNDDTDQPKGFNIQKAVNYTAGLTENAYLVADEPFDENIFPYCKKPPRWKPEIEYTSLEVHEDQTIDFNNLRKKQWQSKYNYVYEDSQESTYSPISIVPLPDGEITKAGVWNTSIITNNALKITVNTGSNNVKKINVAIRDASNLNNGGFYKFLTIEKFDSDDVELIASDIDYVVYFLNNTFLESIDDQYGNAYSHDVPLSAKDLILLDKKYVSMSMPKIGYDFEESEMDYSLSAVEEETDFDSAVIPMQISQPVYSGSGNYDVEVTIPAQFYGNAVYQITISCDTASVLGSYTAPASDPGDYPEVARNFLYDDLNDGLRVEGLCDPVVFGIIPIDDNILRIRYKEDTGFGLTANVITDNYARAYKGLKRGQYHPFAIVYNDLFGRYAVAFGEEELYAPLPDVTVEPLSERDVIKPKITINNIPPIWAHTYRIAYIPYNSYRFVLFVPAVELFESKGNNGIPSGKYFLRINQAILRIIDLYPNSQLSAYVWKNGDRLREWGYTTSYEILDEYTRTYDDDGETIVETGFLIEEALNVTGTPDTDTGLLGKVIDIEIYRPNLTPQDKIYYEIGEEFEILDPGTELRRHAGADQDQSLNPVLPSISTLDFGDIYYRERLAADGDVSLVLVEDKNFNDYYLSSGINIGRGVIRTESVQKILKRVNKSENYLENTKLNRLNIFLPETENYPVSEVYGDITRIRERGDTLKIIQAHKETSVYIGKNYAKDAKGGDIILETDNTFGSELRYDNFIGSLYPRSVGLGDNFLYYFDTMTGDFIRSATNGSISLPKEYGMQLYFEEKAKAFRESTARKDVIVSFESNTSTVYLTFLIGSIIETIAFSEDGKNKGFVFFVEFRNGAMIPEDFAWYGDNMYSFVNGKIYLHNVGNAHDFYGWVRKEAYMDFIANQYPELQKSFETISVDSDGNWTAEMTIESDNNFPNGQRSRILSPMFTNREGSLVSSVPRNILDRNGNESLQRLYSGNEMLGHAMSLRITSTDFDRLREVKITATNQK
jgi:hypothetical protein